MPSELVGSGLIRTLSEFVVHSINPPLNMRIVALLAELVKSPRAQESKNEVMEVFKYAVTNWDVYANDIFEPIVSFVGKEFRRTQEDFTGGFVEQFV